MAGTPEVIEEVRLLPNDIAAAAEAIVRYVDSQSGSEWSRGESGRWRPLKENPITVKSQWKQAKSLSVTLRGNPGEFEAVPELEIVKDQNGYSAFRLEAASQVAAAFSYVRRAYILFERGRTRTQVAPKTIG